MTIFPCGHFQVLKNDISYSNCDFSKNFFRYFTLHHSVHKFVELVLQKIINRVNWNEIYNTVLGEKHIEHLPITLLNQSYNKQYTVSVLLAKYPWVPCKSSNRPTEKNTGDDSNIRSNHWTTMKEEIYFWSILYYTILYYAHYSVLYFWLTSLKIAPKNWIILMQLVLRMTTASSMSSFCSRSSTLEIIRCNGARKQINTDTSWFQIWSQLQSITKNELGRW